MNTARVEEHRFGRSVEGVGVEDGLDHDQGVGHILLVQTVAVERSLVRAVVEILQELRSS